MIAISYNSFWKIYKPHISALDRPISVGVKAKQEREMPMFKSFQEHFLYYYILIYFDAYIF